MSLDENVLVVKFDMTVSFVALLKYPRNLVNVRRRERYQLYLHQPVPLQTVVEPHRLRNRVVRYSHHRHRRGRPN
jgi:hypothetical protein